VLRYYVSLILMDMQGIFRRRGQRYQLMLAFLRATAYPGHP
jgi:hypothetical protein